MAAAIQLSTPAQPLRLPLAPWRDPHTVAPAELAVHIQTLEQACAANPGSPDLWTCLGMAYAMNFDVYKSWDALEAARQADSGHFFAQFKYAELQYRLRVLDCAEGETLHALELAGNAWEASLCRKQLSEIRRLRREGTQKPAWTKPLGAPVAVLIFMSVLVSLFAMWH